MGTGLKKVEDRITDYLNKTIDKGRDSRAFFARYVRPAYISAQRKRFATQNESQGDTWDSLDPLYAQKKLIKFKDFPGGGRKINIATGKMLSGLTLQDRSLSYEVITSNSYSIFFDIENEYGENYVKYVDDVRPVLEFEDEFYDDLKKKCTQWLMGGKV